MKFKGFCAAHGVHIFQPWYKVCAFLKKLVGVEYTYGFIELQSRKKYAPQIQESEKATTDVSFMEVKDLFAAISYWIMLLDKNDQYMRKENQMYSERWLLICGDMGCESTKLALFDTHEANYNCGTKAHLLHYFGGEAKDNASNMGKCYSKLSKVTILQSPEASNLA